ncbi:MAG: hypothetical protein FWC79_06605 [Oscillospiraceae bacterium]|nr:hypothetical protein [Oscillospiraceae bacterium]
MSKFSKYSIYSIIAGTIIIAFSLIISIGNIERLWRPFYDRGEYNQVEFAVEYETQRIVVDARNTRVEIRTHRRG